MIDNKRFEEPILIDDNSRYCQLPIKYTKLQKIYEIGEASIWFPSEIDYSADKTDWENLSDNEKYFIEHILAFFANSDSIIGENIIYNFAKEVKIAEARNWYGYQIFIENIHGMTYALLIDTFINDTKKKENLFKAMDTIPCVKKKSDWVFKWLNSNRPFEERLFAFAVVEQVFFCGAFCAIFWLKNRHKMSKALGKSNELIARDESLHVMFAVSLYHHLLNKINKETAYDIIREAVEIEEEFICQSLPCKLIGMNSDLMKEYIKYVADRLLIEFNFDKLYNIKNPFDFMNNISLDGKTNFFEERVTEYQHSSTATANENSWNFDF